MLHLGVAGYSHTLRMCCGRPCLCAPYTKALCPCFHWGDREPRRCLGFALGGMLHSCLGLCRLEGNAHVPPGLPSMQWMYGKFLGGCVQYTLQGPGARKACGGMWVFHSCACVPYCCTAVATLLWPVGGPGSACLAAGQGMQGCESNACGPCRGLCSCYDMLAS